VPFLDSWTQLSPPDLIRWLLPLGFMAVLVLMPGRRIARLAALGTGIALYAVPEILTPTPLRLVWAAVWAAVAWGVTSAPAPRRGAVLSRRIGLVESGSVGFLLGVALLALLLVAIARQNLPDDPARRATYGIVVLCLGLLHLMLRRHTVRAAIALAMLGLGLQIVERVAHESLVAASLAPGYGIVLATALTCALAVRIGHTRERVATSPWVGDAHDLHD